MGIARMIGKGIARVVVISIVRMAVISIARVVDKGIVRVVDKGIARGEERNCCWKGQKKTQFTFDGVTQYRYSLMAPGRKVSI